MSNEIIEFVAERQEELLEKYLEEGYIKDLWLMSMRNAIKKCEIFPCFSGSALQDIGIDDFLEKLDLLTFTKYSCEEEFSGLVYKIRHDEQGTMVTYIKALSGALKVRDQIYTAEGTYEKVDQIRVYNGSKFKTVDKALAGEIFAVTGLSKAVIGAGIGGLKEKINYEMVPTLKSRVIYDNSLNEKEVLNNFRILEAEDPALNVIWNDISSEIQVHIMGIIQLEVLKQLVQERFNLSIDFGPCQILYKETIATEVRGYGHFEPLGHYAEVHLQLEPGERNRGIEFFNKCHTDDLTVGHQNLVRTHIYEREHHGILTGSPLTDLKITLLTGRAHNRHTSGGDFREAAFRALRQGLEQAKNVLLEPYYRFRIVADLEYMGRILSDIQRLNGSFDSPQTLDNRVIITGRAPVATFMNYSIEFTSLTKGKGKINFSFDGYDTCHNEEEVVADIGYDRKSDIEYTSTSIFCSKGKAFLVGSEESESYMHCAR